MGTTQFLAGKDNPANAGLTRRVRPTEERIREREFNRPDNQGGGGPQLAEGEPPEGAGEGPETVPPTGTVKNLVVLILFSDHAPGGANERPLPSQGDFDTLFNTVGGHATLAPTGSLKDVYTENSYGTMTLESTVALWVTVPQTESWYANGNSGLGTRVRTLIRDALDAVDSQIDFSQFDTDADGRIDSIAFIHSGYGAEWGGTDAFGTTSANRIWSHRWNLGTNGPNLNVWTSAEGIDVWDYHISPGLWGTSGSGIGHIGVTAHETGHFFGLPDLYDTEGTGAGIGSYGMMANSWGFDGSQLYPPHFSPWSKIFLGWVTPTVISAPATYNVAQVETTAQVYRIDDGYPTEE